jgi:hypothetical protein
VQTQPEQIGLNRGLGPGAIARRVEVVESKQEFTAPQPGFQPGQQGGAQIAEMKGAGGGGREATPMARTPERLTALEQRPDVAGKSPGGGDQP